MNILRSQNIQFNAPVVGGARGREEERIFGKLTSKLLKRPCVSVKLNDFRLSRSCLLENAGLMRREGEICGEFDVLYNCPHSMREMSMPGKIYIISEKKPKLYQNKSHLVLVL